MKDLNEVVLEVIEAAEKRGLSKFGVRVITKGRYANASDALQIVKIGDALSNSFQSFDDCESEELDGACAIYIDYDGFEVCRIEKTLEDAKAYSFDGGQVILIGGTSSHEGTDLNETVISEAEVLYIF